MTALPRLRLSLSTDFGNTKSSTHGLACSHAGDIGAASAERRPSLDGQPTGLLSRYPILPCRCGLPARPRAIELYVRACQRRARAPTRRPTQVSVVPAIRPGDSPLDIVNPCAWAPRPRTRQRPTRCTHPGGGADERQKDQRRNAEGGIFAIIAMGADPSLQHRIAAVTDRHFGTGALARDADTQHDGAQNEQRHIDQRGAKFITTENLNHLANSPAGMRRETRRNLPVSYALNQQN